MTRGKAWGKKYKRPSEGGGKKNGGGYVINQLQRTKSKKEGERGKNVIFFSFFSLKLAMLMTSI